MKPDEPRFTQEEVPIVTLIQRIKDGTLDPKMLSREERQLCVEVCVLEGYSVSQVAQLFDRSEKTIGRDLADIRQKNALAPNVEFAKEMIGEMYHKGVNHHTYLMRLARSKEASVAEKTQAEFAAWRVLKELIERFQFLGYLPMRQQEFTGDIFHHVDNEIKSLEELKGELSTVEKVAQESGSLDEDTKGHIKLIQQKLEQAQIAEEIADLAKKNSNDREDLKKEGQNE